MRSPSTDSTYARAASATGTGVAPANIFAVSAATGQGIPPLVRAVRAALDALPVLQHHEQVPTQAQSPSL